MSCALNRTLVKGAWYNSAGCGGGLVVNPRNFSIVAGRVGRYGAESSEPIDFGPPQLPNYKSNFDGRDGVGNPKFGTTEGTPH